MQWLGLGWDARCLVARACWEETHLSLRLASYFFAFLSPCTHFYSVVVIIKWWAFVHHPFFSRKVFAVVPAACCTTNPLDEFARVAAISFRGCSEFPVDDR